MGVSAGAGCCSQQFPSQFVVVVAAAAFPFTVVVVVSVAVARI